MDFLKITACKFLRIAQLIIWKKNKYSNFIDICDINYPIFDLSRLEDKDYLDFIFKINLLPREDIFILKCYFAGLTDKEIARCIPIDSSALRQRRFRILKKIRKNITNIAS